MPILCPLLNPWAITPPYILLPHVNKVCYTCLYAMDNFQILRFCLHLPNHWLYIYIYLIQLCDILVRNGMFYEKNKSSNLVTHFYYVMDTWFIYSWDFFMVVWPILVMQLRKKYILYVQTWCLTWQLSAPGPHPRPSTRQFNFHPQHYKKTRSESTENQLFLVGFNRFGITTSK